MSDAWSGRLKDGTSWSGNNKGNSLIPQKPRVGKQTTRRTVYSNNKKYCRVRGSCGDGHRRKQKYCSAQGKGFCKVTDIRKRVEANHKVKEMKIKGRKED